MKTQHWKFGPFEYCRTGRVWTISVGKIGICGIGTTIGMLYE